MKKKHLFIVIIIYLTTLSITCIRKVDRINTLSIENRLGVDLYIIANYDYPNPSMYNYDKSVLQANPLYKVSAKNSSRVSVPGLCQEHVWEQLVLSDTIHVLILNKDSIDHGVEDSFDEYLMNKKYIREYKLTYNDALRNGCKLVVE